MQWILDRLNEASTWRGIVGLLTAAGVAVSPDMSAQIIATGLALMGVINVFRKEHPAQ